jgi:hypothetical protein
MTSGRRAPLPALALLGCVLLVAPVLAADPATQRYPDVVSVKVRTGAGDAFDFDVTISSPYDTPQRYADAFRIVDKSGAVYGERVLLHDHADEQPFTRDLPGVKIPSGVRTVVIQARDLKNGYGGKSIEVGLPRR